MTTGRMCRGKEEATYKGMAVCFYGIGLSVPGCVFGGGDGCVREMFAVSSFETLEGII